MTVNQMSCIMYPAVTSGPFSVISAATVPAENTKVNTAEHQQHLSFLTRSISHEGTLSLRAL